jgi:hypothetical protein
MLFVNQTGTEPNSVNQFCQPILSVLIGFRLLHCPTGTYHWLSNYKIGFILSNESECVIRGSELRVDYVSAESVLWLENV